jgi:hypothetical protein
MSKVQNLTHAWAAIDDENQPPWVRMEAEANLREAAAVGMVPIGAGHVTVEDVQAACLQCRIDLDFEVSPQPIRFSLEEVRFLISTLESLDVAPHEARDILARLRHRERTAKSARNKDRRVREGAGA